MDITATGNTPVASSMAINSLRFNTGSDPSTISIASGQTLTVASGGILQGSNVGTNITTITGGTLTSGNGQDLIVSQNNGNATGPSPSTP